LTKFYFDKDAANKAIGFIETFITHTKGEKAGQPLILEEWQRKIVGDIFGWKHKDTGLRQYRTVFIAVPRKNGKSTMAAAIGIYMTFADSERGSEIISAAGDRAQAGIVFDIAKQMILNNPELSKRANVFRNSITNEAKGNFYKAISSDSKTKHGLNCNCVIFDELHTQPNRDLWDTLLTSTGARRQPLTIAITTSGYDRQTICYEIYEYAKKIKDKILEDTSFYSAIFEAEDTDDIQDPKVWKKANPNYEISLRKEYMERESQRAIDTPSYLNTYKRLHLNIWTDSLTAWIGTKEWELCKGPIDIKKLKGKKCWAGLDLASTRDISALVLLFKEDDKFLVVPYFFVPKENAKKRSEKDKVDYVTWINQGFIIATEGDVADYNFIQQKIIELKDQYDIQAICYDRWNASQLVINLQDEGVEMDGFGQGYKSMSAPTKEFEKLILGKQIQHDGNPVMNWMLSNVAIMEDPAGNIKCAKNKSKEKIDGIISTIMALGSFMTEENTDSVYDQRGLLIL
jgi:phage terminase large subunit-like protein